ncbi:MAG: prepilin-type N-terminal cleavage/methylation domain-containing protein [Phycisphaerales bacterium]
MARAFSMIELVIVVVIIGIIAAIAIPRFEGMTDNARGRRLIADLDTLQKAAELYTVEHGGVNIGLDSNGSVVTDLVLRRRLLLHTDDDGTQS